MKKFQILLSAAALSACLMACKNSGDTYNIIQQAQTTKTFPVKYASLTPKTVALKPGATTLEFGFMTGKEDIPYVRLNAATFKSFMEKNIEVSSFNPLTNKVTFKNLDRNTTAELDLSKHTIRFENYDLFFQNHDMVYMDPTGCTKLGDYLKIIDAQNIAGSPVTLDWSTQDIDVVLWQDGASVSLAAPLQFVNDVFQSPSQQFVLYNGKDAYLSNALTQEFWTEGNQSGKRSAALAEFCYNELCLNLDFNYGLKAIHGIEKFPDFDTYFKYVGIKDELKSEDAMIFSNAVMDVCESLFGDGHSNYGENSHYLAKDNKPAGTPSRKSTLSNAYAENLLKYLKARGTPYTKDPAAIQKGSAFVQSSDGKTVIVRFDHFALNTNPVENGAQKKAHETDFGDPANANALINNYVYYGNDAVENAYDTMSLLHYVNNLLKTDSRYANVENVVMDLSCNGGGALHSAAFAIAWMLGKCVLEFTNPITGAKWSETYLADVNFDGVYDGNDANVADANKKDTVKDKNLFCIVSPCSFSCGNMVPAMLKASDRVTILGVVSGGGASCVQNASAADGTTFRMSSKYVMSVQKNGSNYDIDKGVDPHYYINKPENFYNVETINSLAQNINSGKLGVTVNP